MDLCQLTSTPSHALTATDRIKRLAELEVEVLSLERQKDAAADLGSGAGRAFLPVYRARWRR
jgi:hypothetical protein